MSESANTVCGTNNHHKPRYADLGLFNQLLQMIDGDWSDSIKGICRHIHNNFNALGVSLAVFDKNFEEFIYLDYSLNDDIPEKLNCAMHYNDAIINITASIGIVQFDPDSHRNLPVLIEHADRKMYAAKNKGRNTIEY